MSILLIQQYYAKVDKLIRYGGSRNETSVRKAFQDLLEQYAARNNLVLVPEVEYLTSRGHKVIPDGTLKDALRQDWGFWESKDEKDDLDAEIAVKFAKGYPQFNILFEDTKKAVLYQSGQEVIRTDFSNANALDELISLFVNYERPEIREFHKAIDQFRHDVPDLANALREIIVEQLKANNVFRDAIGNLLLLCKQAINPKLELADMREMVIQHVLTEDIFNRVFNESEFHRENAIAKHLQEVTRTFYKGATKRNIDARISPYYDTINTRASQISDHYEKQKFLKALYENFYEAYNPKAAERLGVIYTPDEIVKFMIESTNHLVYKNFGKTLGDPYVEILDPATGTGTFITELLEYLPQHQLQYKYENEIHCNEVAILPYYIANLNIEYTFKQITGKYKEFENICFVDTLDNMGFSREDSHQLSMFGLWDENAERIGKQNVKKISVIIGNPPYNAWQENFNNENANRQYPEIDKRIKETYVKAGNAQNQNALYDMYVRFLRWATDRVASNGIIAFVSNSSFIDSKAFDGLRKTISQEFNEIYIIDLKGNARTSGELRRKEGGNIFHNQIKVGIAVYFLIRKQGKKDFTIFYNAVNDFATSTDKLNYLQENKIDDLSFTQLSADSTHNWLRKTVNDWEKLIPLVDKKGGIFQIHSNGIKTQRDEWMFDFSRASLEKKIRYFVEVYQNVLRDDTFPDRMNVKWDRELTKYLRRKIDIEFDEKKIVLCNYRPFTKMYLYYDKYLDAQHYRLNSIFPDGKNNNLTICIDVGKRPFNVLITDTVPDLHFTGDTQCFPLFQYDKVGKEAENITLYALKQFRAKYKDKLIQRKDILAYIYAVLHCPGYRAKYQENLKRDLPRIPLYEDFWMWADWGKSLIELHLNYQKISPYPLDRIDVDPNNIRKVIKPRLIAKKEQGLIEVDTLTKLQGIPDEVWQYRIGTFSAVEWILERHKERVVKDITIRDRFSSYRFSDYKEKVINLIQRVCTVSVETIRILDAMPKET